MPEQVIVEDAASVDVNYGGFAVTASESSTLIEANASREALVICVTTDCWVRYDDGLAVIGSGLLLKATDPPWREESWKGAVQFTAVGSGFIAFTELLLQRGFDQGEQPTGADIFTPAGPGDARPVAHPPVPGVPQT